MKKYIILSILMYGFTSTVESHKTNEKEMLKLLMDNKALLMYPTLREIPVNIKNAKKQNIKQSTIYPFEKKNPHTLVESTLKEKNNIVYVAILIEKDKPLARIFYCKENNDTAALKMIGINESKQNCKKTRAHEWLIKFIEEKLTKKGFKHLNVYCGRDEMRDFWKNLGYETDNKKTLSPSKKRKFNNTLKRSPGSQLRLSKSID